MASRRESGWEDCCPRGEGLDEGKILFEDVKRGDDVSGKCHELCQDGDESQHDLLVLNRG